MGKYFYTLLGTLFVLLGMGSGANALLIDFTSNDPTQDWSGMSGLTYSKTVYGIDVGISGNGGLLTFNADDPSNDINLDPYLNGWGDGIGIGDDEVSTHEVLTITFSTQITATHLYLLDVFLNGENEGAQISFNGGSSWLFVSAPVQNSFGFVDIDLSSYGAFNSLSFITKNDNGNSDFSVAGLDIKPVPEPATMLLFGAGLAGLAGLQVRRKKK